MPARPDLPLRRACPRSQVVGARRLGATSWARRASCPRRRRAGSYRCAPATGSTCSRTSPPGDSTRWWVLADANPCRRRDAARAARPDRSSCPMPDTRLLVEIDGDRRGRRGPRASCSSVQVEEALDEADAATLVAARSRPAPTASGRACSTRCSTPRTPLVVQVIARRGRRYRFDGLLDRGDLAASTRTGALAADRQGGRPHARARPRGEGRRLAGHVGQRDRRGDLRRATASRPRSRRRPTGPTRTCTSLLQRGTDLAFLRSLAAKWGYAVYLEADGGAGHRPLPPARPARRARRASSRSASAATRSSVHGAARSSRRASACRPPGSRRSPTAPQSGDSAGDDQAQGPHVARRAARRVLLAPADVDGEVDPLAAATGARPRGRRSRVAARPRGRRRPASGSCVRARRPDPRAGARLVAVGPATWSSACGTRSRVERHRQQLTLVRNALGLTGDEPFGARALGGLAVIERFHGKYVGDRRRQRRPEGPVPGCAVAGARGLRRGDDAAGACRAARTPAPGVGLAAVPPVGSLVFVEWPAGDITRVPIWSGGVVGRTATGVDDAGPDALVLVTPAGHRDRAARRRRQRGDRDRGGVRREAHARLRRRRGRVRQPEDRAHAAAPISLNDGALEVIVMAGFVLDARRDDHLPARRAGRRVAPRRRA